MKTYLINLDRSPDRLEWFMRTTRHLGLDVVRISGFDGMTLSKEEATEIISKRQGSGGMNGRADIGCFLSHRKTWQRIVEGNDRWAFVAEDDIHLAPGAERFLKSDDWIPHNADIIKAETWLTPVRITLWNNPSVFGHSLKVLHSTHLGAGGYFISSECASNMLRWTEDAYGIPDRVLFDECVEFFPRLHIYQIDPAICIQDFKIKNDRRVGFDSVRTEANVKDGVKRRHVYSEKKRGALASLARVIARPFEHFWRNKGLLPKGQWVKMISFGNPRVS